MKNFILLIVGLIMMTQSMLAQVTFSGDVQYFSKNTSLATGLVYDEDPAAVLHLNATYKISDRFGVSGFYTGHSCRKETGITNQYHLVDALAHYNITDDLVLYTGPELVYKRKDNNNITDIGLIGMMTWSKQKFSTSLIVYTNPQFQFFYYIGSVTINLRKDLSAYVLGAYTTAEPTPVYGLSGLKYSSGRFFTGVYYVFRSDAPGPMFNIGFTF